MHGITACFRTSANFAPAGIGVQGKTGPKRLYWLIPRHASHPNFCWMVRRFPWKTHSIRIPMDVWNTARVLLS